MIKPQRIYSIKKNALNEEDRLAIATLLVKAGYTVRIDSEKVGNTSTQFIEFCVHELNEKVF